MAETHKINGFMCVKTNIKYISQKMKVLCVNKSAVLPNFSSGEAF